MDFDRRLEAALDREAELDRQLKNMDEGRDTEDDYEALRALHLFEN